ncbi:acyl-CoA dehydrogenase family protein [Sphingomonas sp. 37zxx]|uniref:acyl-CoA dehydrogenase family protein n=1 Tax=Sphingomonas sp. 37zxx TaxID=1550073 RepID=UPI00053BFB6F|nr:acyl-CoA dehydrogenase family protein [Sphingomonas sp. 37zxx]
MDLGYNPEYDGYRQAVRTFLSREWPSERPSREARKALERAFRLKAIEAGYLYRSVPRAYGGSEQPVDLLRAQIIREEFARASAPMEIQKPGVNMLVPTLLERGTEAQKQRFIPATINGDIAWTQGYSEPASGSDLASLRTRGELVGGEWILNGQKIWSSFAGQADYMFALIRTEPDAPTKHQGISYLLIDLKQPGVTVRPLKQMNGGAEFCEVFFDDARTPADWIVGARGEGWAVSKATLKHERSSIGGADRTQQRFDRLLHLARTTRIDGRPVIEHPDLRIRLAEISGALTALKYSSYRQLSMNAQGESAGIVEMMAKLYATEIGHAIAHAARDVMGDAFLLAPPPEGTRGSGPERFNNQYMGSLGVAIAGGTSNIQRNIITERGLGLPRDSQVEAVA